MGFPSEAIWELTVFSSSSHCCLTDYFNHLRPLSSLLILSFVILSFHLQSNRYRFPGDFIQGHKFLRRIRHERDNCVPAALSLPNGFTAASATMRSQALQSHVVFIRF